MKSVLLALMLALAGGFAFADHGHDHEREQCEYYPNYTQCLSTYAYGNGCRWSSSGGGCYQVHYHQCSYYTRYGYEACLQTEPYGRGCRWDSGAGMCFRGGH